ncbi:unnamed protein product [Moneuplotes crassus]|uniref:Protein kinase domain-containing protein n=1 Tax=Euplotes crassus TaxID=5936 RepID=A0AAD1U7Z5_EUPCR|nr:unnamed protein product [Moneuplotes crassus]
MDQQPQKQRIEYYGQKRDGLYHGFGKAFYRSGELYIGSWYKGKRHGKGSLFFRKGDRYTGYWKNDTMEGEGVMVTGPGITFTGKFKSNKKHGEGKIVYTDGKEYYEKWDDGVLLYHKSTVSGQDSEDIEPEVEEENDLEKELRGVYTSPRQSLPHELKEMIHPGYLKMRDKDIGDKQSTIKRYGKTSVRKDSELIKNLEPKVMQTEIEEVKVKKENDAEEIKRTNKKKLSGSLKANTKTEVKEDEETKSPQGKPLTKHKRDDSKDVNGILNLSELVSKKRSKELRSRSVVMNSTEKSNRTTIFKSKHLELSEKLSEGFVTSKRSSGFNLVIDFSDLHFSLKNDLIATGGYGEVYKGKWLGLPIAIKRFGKKYINKKAIKELIKEIEVVHSCRHPYIVLYLGVSFDKYNHYYMVTEYVSKGSLFHILHKKNLLMSEMKAFTIAKQIAIALNYLHSQNILHCDLKSQNILIKEDWSVKICDFGLSKIRGISPEEDKKGRVGTPHWMAPEILRGNKYEAASDVYSYGVILWELITRQIPFLHRSLAQITGLVGYYGQKLPIPKTKNCPSGVLQKLAKNCLVFEPYRRPSFDQIISYLEKYEFKIHCGTQEDFLEELAEFIS